MTQIPEAALAVLGVIFVLQLASVALVAGGGIILLAFLLKKK
jgi:hypothetical protein